MKKSQIKKGDYVKLGYHPITNSSYGSTYEEAYLNFALDNPNDPNPFKYDWVLVLKTSPLTFKMPYRRRKGWTMPKSYKEITFYAKWVSDYKEVA